MQAAKEKVGPDGNFERHTHTQLGQPEKSHFPRNNVFTTNYEQRIQHTHT